MKRLFLLALFAGSAHAADQTAASCSYADVSTAYAAAVDNDRVLIPACAATNWSGSVLTVSKGIQVVGNGVGSTNLRNGRFTITTPDGKAVRVTAMTLLDTVGFNVTGTSKAMRFDHIDFRGTAGTTSANDTHLIGFTEDRLFWLSPTGGYSAGLIDHVTITLLTNGDASTVGIDSIQVHHREGDGGNSSWQRPVDLGGPDAWYVEDSTFVQGEDSYDVSSPITDCDGGGRIVFRYNSIDKNYFEMHDSIVAGILGCRKWEIYENTWNTVQSGQYSLIAIRGGTGVVFNNTFTQDSTTGTDFDIIFSNYRSGGEVGGDPWTSTCQTSGSTKACFGVGSNNPQICANDAACGGVAGSCVKIDGSGLGTGLTNYPCRGQMGTIGFAPQRIHPALFWNNKHLSSQRPPTQQAYSDATYLVEGRDYCIGPTTGSGDDGTQPTTCGGKSTPYTPYTYPHPLQSGFYAPKPPTSGSVN